MTLITTESAKGWTLLSVLEELSLMSEDAPTAPNMLMARSHFAPGDLVIVVRPGKLGDTVPVGSLVPPPSEEFDPMGVYGGTESPDGRELSREKYPELFAVIGTTHGEGDGATTFNLPNKTAKNDEDQ